MIELVWNNSPKFFFWRKISYYPFQVVFIKAKCPCWRFCLLVCFALTTYIWELSFLFFYVFFVFFVLSWPSTHVIISFFFLILFLYLSEYNILFYGYMKQECVGKLHMYMHALSNSFPLHILLASMIVTGRTRYVGCQKAGRYSNIKVLLGWAGA